MLEVVDSGRGAREYMAACTQLFLDNLLLECGANCSVVPDTDVHVRLVTRTEDLTLNWNTDETYTLDIISSSRGGYRAIALLNSRLKMLFGSTLNSSTNVSTK